MLQNQRIRECIAEDVWYRIFPEVRDEYKLDLCQFYAKSISWQRHVNNEVVKFYDPMESIHPYVTRHHKIIHYHDRRCTPLRESFFLSHILPFTFLTFCRKTSKVTSFHPFSKRTSCSSYSFSNFAIDWIQLIYFFIFQIYFLFSAPWQLFWFQLIYFFYAILIYNII